MESATGALGTLLPKLGKLLLKEYNLKNTVKKGIGNLKAELEAMQVALEKISNVPLDQLDTQVKLWANEVRELSFVIEDSLDSSMVRIDGLEPTKPHTFKGFIKKTRNKVSKFKIRHRIADDIKDINIQVKDVKERYERYRVSDFVANHATTMVDPCLLAMYSKVSDLVGIDKVIDELTDKLSEGGDPSGKTPKVVSIVGFGGLGKTTLAKAVYDKLHKKFDCRAFVPVGQNPDTKKVLRDILLELDTQLYRDAATMDERQLINQLQKFLADKRYLIVIDDLWDIPTWEVIKCAMRDSCSGSRIIVATRICGVAEKVGEVHNMKSLSDENSKKLFFSRIFGADQGIDLDNQYDKVSSKYLWRCGGVPLSIITIASLLAGKKWEDWCEVYDSIGFGHEENEVVENTRKILSFSYYDLPSCRKTCLLHLSIFREDFTVEKESLIWMWIAEGFIPDKSGTRLFELGESYLNKLVNRNMIQLVEPSLIGKQSVCRVHDTVYDLICSLSRQVNFSTVYNKGQHNAFSPCNSVRRLAIHRGNVEHNSSMEMGRVRSFNVMEWQNSRMPSLLSFKVLRVLVFYRCYFCKGGCDLQHLRKLVHLRYLGLVHTPDVELPVEIGHDLKFMQTLDVRSSGIELPPSIGELNKLMCLHGDEGTRLMFEIGKLKSLVELELFVGKSPHFFTQLGNLNELRMLKIWFDEIDESAIKDMVESLGSLCRVQYLRISFVSKEEKRIQVDGWEDWTPPLVLRQLLLVDIILPRRPLWLDSSCVLHLSSLWFEVEVVDRQDLRTLGGLPLLCNLYLRLWKMKGFSYTVGSDEFLKLRYLDTNMEIMTCGVGVLPMLEQLKCSATVGRHNKVGLVPENMPLLEQVTYQLDCQHCNIGEMFKAAVELSHMTETHPNHPTGEIMFDVGDGDDDDDDDDEDEDKEEEEEDDGPEEVLPPDKELLQPAVDNRGTDEKTSHTTRKEVVVAGSQP